MAEQNTDVIIVGGGGAGVAAALEAGAAGASVVLVELAEELGGTAAISGGGCCMVGTPLQREKGIEDHPDLAFDDWVKCGEGAADEPWARYYIEHTLHDLYFWLERLGVRWIEVNEMEQNTVRRWHRPDNNGLGIMTAMIASLRSQGRTRVLAGTRVEKLLAQDGRVCGLRTVNVNTGEQSEIRGRTVVVATGGFNSNLERVLEARPELKTHKVMEGSGPGALGIGHRLLAEQGSYFTHLQNISFYVYATPDYRQPKRGFVFRGTPGYVWVNQQGKRFHDESLNGAPSATPAVLKQDPPHAWAILDSAMMGAMQVADPYYREGDKIRRDRIEELLQRSPFIRHAATLEESRSAWKSIRARFSARSSATTRRSMRHWHASRPSASRSRAARSSMRLRTSRIQLFPLARKNLGGVKTDLRCRVLNKFFEPVPGLYAAGEVAGMAGGHINGKTALEGTMLGPSIFSGRVAGGWAAHEADFGPGFVGRANRPAG